MPYSNGVTVVINDNQAEYARKVSARMSNPALRKKGMTDLVGLMCAIDYFVGQGFLVDASSALHKIPEVFEEFKINDIYINNYRVDVISTFSTNKIRIPIQHRHYGCEPDFYVVVLLNQRLKDANVLGFFRPSDIISLEPQGADSAKADYINVDNTYIKGVNTLNMELRRPAYPKAIVGKHLDCMGMFLRFIDKELAASAKRIFITHLLTCPGCTKKLADVLEFNRAVQGIENIGDVMQKYAAPKKTIQSIKEPDIDLEKLQESFKKLAGIEQEPPSDDKKYQKIIDGIFDKSTKIDSKGLGAIIGSKKKKIILTAVVILAFLATAVGIALRNSSSDDISSISDVEASYSQDAEYDEQMQNDFTSSHSLPQEVYGVTNGVDYSLASQSNGEPLVATINKISWEVPENLANKANYTRFLQLVGKNIKLNLQNDLLLSSDFAKNNVIKLSIRIASNGDVIGMKMLKGSGSTPIDDIIKKSVSETLMYMKPPSHGFISRPVDVVLIINL